MSFDERRRQTLRVLCDTFIAGVRPPEVESHDPTGFWSRTASDLGVPARVEQEIEALEPVDRDGMIELLDALTKLGFSKLPRGMREAAIRTLRRLDEGAKEGLDAYRGIAMLDFYGRPVGGGHSNPNWEQLGYPGPPEVEPSGLSITPHRPEVDADGTATLETDVVVVGSGSGGGVVAGELAQAGLDVVVLEAGGHVEGDDFPPDEARALRELYWRGGVQLTEDRNVAIMAGATLGGGSTINWQNCVGTPEQVRSTWAERFGLKDLDTPAWDEQLDAVRERISVNMACSDLNGPNTRLRQGAEELGWGWHIASRNAESSAYDPDSAGHVGYGDRTGSKQGTLKTYLQDAHDAGARIVVRATGERILTDAGRAAGVEAIWTAPDGRRVGLTVRARHVVVACGALETPALLLRSGIGGPAVGRYLRVHPVPNIAGFYAEAQRPWWGPPQSVIVDELSDAVDGHGFLIETPHYHPGITGATVPWSSAREHKLVMGRLGHAATFLAVTRERGAGEVTTDDKGRAIVRYPLDDPFDRDLLRNAVESLVRLHVAAGAETIIDLHPAHEMWCQGDDPDAFAKRIAALPLGKDERVLFTAHQMGSARMGRDATVSVANPDGELHDAPGVWIGDTSAFPTAVGANPMLTCMALARRTSQALRAND